MKITFEGGSKSTEFLDVVFDLSNSSYFPYVKPNTSTNYVSVESSHPKTVIQSIPKGISKRLSTNSSSEEEFHNNTGHFKEALSRAGYHTGLDFVLEEKKKKCRKRKVMYFNPPWSANISTNVGGKFLSLVRKHFPKGSPLHHLFNTNVLKVSYSTTPNMKQLIAGHNAQVITRAEGRQEPDSYGCNCGPGEQCPLDGECKTPALIY